MNRDIKQYLGIDWGEKRIGLAMADGETKMAIPFGTANNLREVLDTVAQEEIDEVVVGSPQKMSGAKADNPQWLSFVKQLEAKTDGPVRLMDERLSSLAADALVGQKKDKANRDEVAATIILQNYLDKLT